MRKIILFLLWSVVFYSCSDEVGNEYEEKKNVLTSDPQIPYESPFGATSCCSVISYEFINETNLDLTFTPYVGLARFDGAYDNNHFGWLMSNLFNYPNVLSNGMEYLNLVECLPISVFAFNTLNYNTIGQLPTHPIPSLSPVIFEVLGKTPGTITSEDRLLYEYGKFYYFEATVMDPLSSVIVINEEVKFPFLPVNINDPNVLSTDWDPVPAISPETEDLWYNVQTREICIGNNNASFPLGGLGLNNVPSIVNFSYMGENYVLEAIVTSTSFTISLKHN